MSLESINSIRSHKAAHWAGVILGIFLGIVLLSLGIGALFSSVWQTPLQGITLMVGVLAALSVLPLAVVAIFRPRFAARTMGLCWLLFLVASLPSANWGDIGGVSLVDVIRFITWFFALPGGVIALLWHAGPDTAPHAAAAATAEAPGRLKEVTHVRPRTGAAAGGSGALDMFGVKRLAKWVALILGLGVGMWRFQWAWHSALHAPTNVAWVVAGFAAPWLAAIPLALLGAWKPRWAAYAFGACFLVLMASPMRGAHSLGDIFGYLLFMGLPALPFALVAALLFYASQPDTGA